MSVYKLCANALWTRVCLPLGKRCYFFFKCENVCITLDDSFEHIQSDHKKTPQLISFLFEIRFQRAVHQIKGFIMYYKLDIKCCP
jgi:hypothetical protein